MHLIAENNNLHWLKQFDVTSNYFFLYFNIFDRS